MSLGKGRLLIVEDEIDFRDLLVELLQPCAEKILVAGNGKEALEIIKSGQVDAVVTDIKMPVMDGLKFLAEVRSQLIQVPVIVLTGHGDIEAAREALRLDATDFVEKPFQQDYLCDTVERALEYGLALSHMEAELDALYAASNLPPEQIAKIKRVSKVTRGMRIGFSMYTKQRVS